MSYRLIQGEFVLGYSAQRGRDTDTRSSQPDGDSMWFRASDVQKWQGIGPRAPRLSPGGTVQLRFDAIDALELHYEGGHQRLDLAIAARDALIEKIGFRDVAYGKSGIAVASARTLALPGHVLVRAIDDTPGGRPIVLAYAGHSTERDGTTVEPTRARVRRSLNAYLLRHGLAYPMLYTTLPAELAPEVARNVELARIASVGLWADGIDRTSVWTRLGGPTHLKLHAIWPKLFRRLHEFMRLDKALGKLDDWMAIDPASRDDEVIIGGSQHARLHDVLEVDGPRIRMRCDPLDIVVKSGATVVSGGAS